MPPLLYSGWFFAIHAWDIRWKGFKLTPFDAPCHCASSDVSFVMFGAVSGRQNWKRLGQKLHFQSFDSLNSFWRLSIANREKCYLDKVLRTTRQMIYATLFDKILKFFEIFQKISKSGFWDLYWQGILTTTYYVKSAAEQHGDICFSLRWVVSEKKRV